MSSARLLGKETNLQGKQPLEDAGAIVPNARKHQAQAHGPNTQDSVCLADLWPEPDWKNLIACGMTVEVAAAIAMMRDGLANKPRASMGFYVTGSQWHEAYCAAIPLLRDLLLASQTAEAVRSISSRLAAHMGSTPKEIAKQHPTAFLVYWAAGRGTSTLRPPGNMTTRQTLLARFLPKLGWPEDQSALRASLIPWPHGDGTWRVCRIESTTLALVDPTVYQTEQEAIDAVVALAKNEVSGAGIPTRRSAAGGTDRIGPDRRDGKDIDPASLMAAFGLRAVQFGNSVSQRERQVWMNEAHDALADLADVLQWPRKWIGLGGLALAIGARGQGLRAATAHFEADQNAINLTRASGAGSLAHEWSHALDARLCKGAIAAKIRPYDHFKFMSCWSGSADYPPPESGKYAAIILGLEKITVFRHGKKSNFYLQARKIAALRKAGAYWTEPEEMFARGFEAFVEDRLLELERRSPWLVHGTLESDYDLSVVAACPYPVGEERKALNFLNAELVALLARPT